MLRFSARLRNKVVTADSKEGKEYIASRMRYTRQTNQLWFGFILCPILYAPYHYYYNEPELWASYKDPYALAEGVNKSETLREKRAREAAEAAAAAERGEVVASSSSSAEGGSVPKAKPTQPVGNSSVWLRGGTFKDSLNVKPPAKGDAAADAPPKGDE